MTDAASHKTRVLKEEPKAPSAPLADARGITRGADGDYTVPATVLAEGFGLTPDVFWREMKRGIVHGVVERGQAEDAGRTRLTFRYRARSWSITLEDAAP